MILLLCVPTTKVPIPTTNQYLITSSKLFINGRINRQSLPGTPLHLNIMTQTPQKMTPLRMLQKRFLQIHVSLLHEHGDDASILDVGVFVEFVADGLLGFWEGEVYVVDCEDAWEFSVDGNCDYWF